MSGRHKWSDIRHKSTPEQREQERDRLDAYLALWEGVTRIEQRGMAFQDEAWWPQFCALRDALGVDTNDLPEGVGRLTSKPGWRLVDGKPRYSSEWL